MALLVGCCTWCGADLLEEMAASGQSVDQVSDSHAEVCVPFQLQLQGINPMLPPCSGDEE